MNDADKNRKPRALLVLSSSRWWYTDTINPRVGPFDDAGAARAALVEAGFVEAGFRDDDAREA